MALRRYSRYMFSTAQLDDADRFYLSSRVPFRYTDLSDNRVHVVAQGEDVFGLAHRYFAPLDEAKDLWWAICDFQPDPIVDPTLALRPGRVLFIPSIRTVTELVFSESRRGEEPIE